MEAKSQQLEDREGAILALNKSIQAVYQAETSSIMLSLNPGSGLSEGNRGRNSATTAFSAVRVLLIALKVHFLVFYNHVLQIHVYPGLDD